MTLFLSRKLVVPSMTIAAILAWVFYCNCLIADPTACPPYSEMATSLCPGSFPNCDPYSNDNDECDTGTGTGGAAQKGIFAIVASTSNTYVDTTATKSLLCYYLYPCKIVVGSNTISCVPNTAVKAVGSGNYNAATVKNCPGGSSS